MKGILIIQSLINIIMMKLIKKYKMLMKVLNKIKLDNYKHNK